MGFLCCGTLENVFDSVQGINWQWKKLAIGNVVFGRLPNYLAEYHFNSQKNRVTAEHCGGDGCNDRRSNVTLSGHH